MSPLQTGDEENEAEGDRGVLLYRCMSEAGSEKAKAPFTVILGLQFSGLGCSRKAE